jgi:hypothetical protein
VYRVGQAEQLVFAKGESNTLSVATHYNCDLAEQLAFAKGDLSTLSVRRELVEVPDADMAEQFAFAKA